MEKSNSTDNQSKKLTYEELEQKCVEIMNQNRYITTQAQKMQEALAYRRIDYLFKVLDKADLFSTTFVNDIVKEIEDTLTTVQEEK